MLSTETSVNWSSNIKDHWSQFTITNKKYNNNEKVWKMKITKIVQRHEMSKCYWKNGTNRLAWCTVATNLQFVKNTVSWNSVKWGTIKWGMTVNSRDFQKGDDPHYQLEEKDEKSHVMIYRRDFQQDNFW